MAASKKGGHKGLGTLVPPWGRGLSLSALSSFRRCVTMPGSRASPRACVVTGLRAWQAACRGHSRSLHPYPKRAPRDVGLRGSDSSAGGHGPGSRSAVPRAVELALRAPGCEAAPQRLGAVCASHPWSGSGAPQRRDAAWAPSAERGRRPLAGGRAWGAPGVTTGSGGQRCVSRGPALPWELGGPVCPPSDGRKLAPPRPPRDSESQS